MANFRLYVLTAVFCTVIVFGHAEDFTTKIPSTVSIAPLKPESPEVTKLESSPSVPDSNVTSTSPTTPETTTSKPTTTTTTTTITTPKSTSTESTTTTSTTTSTPPTTTTVAPVTTTPAPGPVPPPKENTWKFSESGSNVSCIMVHFAAQLDVTYTETVNNSAKLKHIILNVPATANVTDGSCGNVTQWLTIGWPVTNGSTINNTLTLFYEANSTAKSYALKQLNVTLAKEVFPNSNSSVVLSHGWEWQTPLATSYRCERATRLPMSAEDTGVAANLTVSHLQEEAFRTVPGTGFSAGRECGGNDVPDAVPIAVGCALGGLVLVVLVAYLVARRRSAARGYLSM